MNRETALRILLALIGLAHLALGAISNLAPPETLVRVVSAVYGATIEMTPQLHHVIRILGVFMIGVGVLAFLASRDPRRNQAIVTGIIVILVLRVFQRILLGREIIETFDIAPASIWIQAAFFLATAAALIALRPRPLTPGS